MQKFLGYPKLILAITISFCAIISTASLAATTSNLYQVVTKDKTLEDRLSSVPLLGKALKTPLNGKLLYFSYVNQEPRIWFLGYQKEAVKSGAVFTFTLETFRFILDPKNLSLIEEKTNSKRTYMLKSLHLDLPSKTENQLDQIIPSKTHERTIRALTEQVSLISKELEKKNTVIGNLESTTNLQVETILRKKLEIKKLKEAVANKKILETEITKLKSKIKSLSLKKTTTKAEPADNKQLMARIKELEDELKSARVTIKVLGNIKNQQ